MTSTIRIFFSGRIEILSNVLWFCALSAKTSLSVAVVRANLVLLCRVDAALRFHPKLVLMWIAIGLILTSVKFLQVHLKVKPCFGFGVFLEARTNLAL